MTTPYYRDDPVTLYYGNCLDVLRELPDCSVDSVVTDPPYGLSNTNPQQVADTITRWVNGDREYVPTGKGFMGKPWDAFVPPVAVWDECLRVLKPGGHVLAFAGSRTHDLMTLGIRLAGFEIRDSVAWLYGSGFPKSLDVSKAIDKAAGATPIDTGIPSARHNSVSSGSGQTVGYQVGIPNITAPATPDAERWQGWGTALKPAHEPVVMARKPLAGTVAANVLAHGTGALNVEACRIGTEGGRTAHTRSAGTDRDRWDGNEWTGEVTLNGGRWPANVILDESQAAALDEQSGEGGASRFFYVAKAKKSERPVVDGVAHPTVKPLAIMAWLVRLVTPPDGTVLEPFAGSGTTVEACIVEGFPCVAVEREAEYLPLILARIERATQAVAEATERADDEPGLFDLLNGDA